MEARRMLFTRSRRLLVHLVPAGQTLTACGMRVVAEVAWPPASQDVTCNCCRRQIGLPALPPPPKVSPSRMRMLVAKAATAPRRRPPPARSEPRAEPNVLAILSRLRRENSELYPWVCYVERWKYLSYDV